MKEHQDIEPKPQDPAPESAEERQGRTALTSSSLCRRFLSARNVVAIAIAGSLLYFLMVQFDLDLESTWLELQRTDPAWYAAAFAIYYLNFPIRSIRWRVLLEDSGCEAPDARDKISILTLSEIGYLGWFLKLGLSVQDGVRLPVLSAFQQAQGQPRTDSWLSFRRTDSGHRSHLGADRIRRALSG